ncbi:MAG TPA: hypothetical protein VKX39_14270 [Bryobacteraceae bacterium]|jgi:hypothetical protein|nr:hypothetical protein [Bryobacteraceae bacterium]
MPETSLVTHLANLCDERNAAALEGNFPGLLGPTVRVNGITPATVITGLTMFPIMAISAPAVPGAGEAVRPARRNDVDVIGLSPPSICKPYVHEGVVQTVVLWSVRDLGYLSVYASVLAAERKIPPGASSIQAGRLGSLRIQGSDIILGSPLIINKQNIDQLDF